MVNVIKIGLNNQYLLDSSHKNLLSIILLEVIFLLLSCWKMGFSFVYDIALIITILIIWIKAAVKLMSLFVCLLVVKEAQSDWFSQLFSNFWRWWFHKVAHNFLKTNGKSHSWKVFFLEDINENDCMVMIKAVGTAMAGTALALPLFSLKKGKKNN